MASIFKKRVLKEKLESFEIPNFQPKLDIVTQWYEAYKNGSLKKKTESEVEHAFIQNIFCEVLDYTRYPSEPHTIIPQGKTQTSGQKPDAILGHFKSDKDITKVAAVCEIKDANTPLDKSQRREGSLSPVQQAFKYKTQYKNCDFVIATNFFEIRLLKDNELNYEKWTLEDLVNPANNHYEFKKFYYLLCEKHLVVARGKSKTLQILSDIQVEQEKITKEFYKLYKELRQKLIKNIIKNNPEAKKRENFYHLTVEKAQKIIDRLVFVAFCEDLGLLPENILLDVIKLDNINEYNTTWEILKGFFKAVDTGSKKLGNAEGYNGELFKPDKDLDKLIIDNDICREFIKIGQYDFSEDLSVNILGHIFEQSISDLEELKLLGEGQDFDSKKTKRKKDGIFYTPEYIVDYIVENAVGAWLKEREDEMMEKHNVKTDLKDKNYNKRLLKAYEEYRDILQNIKVLDPACGSGAFLVRVFDFLLAENQRVADMIASLQDGAMSLFDTEQVFKDILQNNIYGVDLNPESVEITKLSLWLKTAQKGKKLASLYNNIKCGNSLIDDQDIVGAKAFKWEEEFKGIMEQGGFDVVVGNPPYGVNFSKSEKEYLLNFDPEVPDYEIYVYFISLYRKILNKNGYLSYIFPNTFLSNHFGHKYRSKLINEIHISELINLSEDNTFKDASVRTIIFTFKNKIPNNSSTTNFGEIIGNDYNNVIECTLGEMKDNIENLFNLFYQSPEEKKLIEKIKYNKIIDELFDVSQGLIPYDKYRGHDEETIKNRIWHSDFKKDNTYKKEIQGRDVLPFNVSWNGNLWLSYGDWLAAPRDPKFFNEPRVLLREITSERLQAAFTEDELYNTPSVINIISKETNKSELIVLQSIINSSLIGWYHNKTSPKANKGLFPKILINDVRNLPVKFPENTDTKLLETSHEISRVIQKKISLINNFQDLLLQIYSISKWPRSLSEFWTVSFDMFIKKLKLKKLSLTEKDELLKLWKKYTLDLKQVEEDILSLYKVIDNEVFNLYDLTPEERKIVLESTSN